jgi:hypothetical protein
MSAQSPNKTPKPRKSPLPSSDSDDKKVITRGRVSHVEQVDDQPAPMPVRKSGERDTISR